jgi:hypothetical protein
VTSNEDGEREKNSLHCLNRESMDKDEGKETAALLLSLLFHFLDG